jgi:hypothetical protein
VFVSAKGLNNSNATSDPAQLCTYITYALDLPAGSLQKGTVNPPVNYNANPSM